MQQRSEETRNRILMAAVDCFSERGYDVTSVAEICEAAGVSKGAFYHHFPTKQAVFLSLMETWLGGLDEQLRALMDAAPDVPSGFAHMSFLVGEVFTVAGGHLPMFLEFWTQSMRDPTVWQVVIAPYRRYQDLFAEFIQRGVDEGSLKRLDMDYVDLLYCHRADRTTPIEETVWAMHNIIEWGKALYWGTSEWPAADIGPSRNQCAGPPRRNSDGHPAIPWRRPDAQGRFGPACPLVRLDHRNSGLERI